MECELEVVCFEMGVVLFKLVQCVNYLVYSYNRYNCA
jgi:hypothetical protein